MKCIAYYEFMIIKIKYSLEFRNEPMKMFPEIWIAGTWSIWVGHNLQKKKNRGIKKTERVKEKGQKNELTYEGISRPHVFAADLDARFRCNNNRHEFMTIVDLLVSIVCYAHFHTRTKIIYHLTYNSPHC